MTADYLPRPCVIALSFSPSMEKGRRAEWVNRAECVMQTLCGQTPTIVTLGNQTVLVCGLEPDDVLDPVAQTACVFITRGAYSIDGLALSPSTLLDGLKGADTLGILSMMAAPFGACFSARPEEGVVFTTDSIGLRHLHWWQGIV